MLKVEKNHSHRNICYWLQHVFYCLQSISLSVPNLQNIKYIDAITSGNFLYDNTGLFDQTHIRFFTLKSLLGYLEQQNFKIISNGWRPDISIQNIK